MPKAYSGLTVREGDAEEQCRQAQRSGIVQRAPEPSAVTPHPLVGAGVHFKDQYGRVHDRAAIVAVLQSNNAAVGDLVLLQYFERDEPPRQRLLPLAELSSGERWVLYKSVAEMIWADSQQKAREDAIFGRMMQPRTALPEKVSPDTRNAREAL
jgi:hypothetical protein